MEERRDVSVFNRCLDVLECSLTFLLSLIEKNKTFRELVISIAATYGLYFIGR
jgi:hypothetical protein